MATGLVSGTALPLSHGSCSCSPQTLQASGAAVLVFESYQGLVKRGQPSDGCNVLWSGRFALAAFGHPNDMAYSILRFGKLKSAGQIKASQGHCTRTRETPNAGFLDAKVRKATCPCEERR
ncbi:hypothetical protein [Stenomitos frigidus]|uniref:hypothetical protein n=1 Tax=Stenomitos frigidus TaxID=1886765 RepID=UPI0011B1F34A|nr:hypothetical protein [Stenomitos frigidus]